MTSRCSSEIKLKWKCKNEKHEDYERSPLNSKQCEFRCPMCVLEEKVSNLETKVYEYLKTYKYTILRERDCTIIPINPKTNYQLLFDNEIMEKKIIIEVHGEQHYNTLNKNSSWLNGKTPTEFLEELQYRDKYKKSLL